MNFQTYQIGFERIDFRAGAVLEIGFQDTKRLVKNALGRELVTSEVIEPHLIVGGPVVSVLRHLLIDLIYAFGSAQEEPVVIDELFHQGLFAVIGGLVFVPPALVEGLVLSRVLVAQKEHLGAAAVFGGVLRGDRLTRGCARAGGAMWIGTEACAAGILSSRRFVF